MTRRGPSMRRWLLAVAIVSTASSCAYYNTFYLARKYYDRGTNGEPYVVDKPDGASVANFSKSIEYCKKLLASYPKSKWVDDAYLLWARSLIGKDDPLQTVNMLRDFGTRYPSSSLRNTALFYQGVASRKSRAYTDALTCLDDYLKRAPKGDLAPYALLERARVLMALNRPGEAAASAGQVVDRFSKSKLGSLALLQRADALLAQGDNAHAREDYHELGLRATTDEDRFALLLKEADCLEAARNYDEELALLQNAAGHEQEPFRAENPVQSQGQQQPQQQQQQPMGPGSASNERWGRLTLRIGTVHLQAGRTDRALQTFQRIVDDYPRTALAAEAQYRIAYTYETTSDDFDRARTEYAKVQGQMAASQYSTQATQRLASLDRLAQFRAGTGADSVAKKAEAGFLLAEQYLFQLDKPDRAIEEYRNLSRTYAGTEFGGKALNAEAWVLRNKYQHGSDADSILWVVVRKYPKTEAQVDARDYLERYGHEVPADLIQLPEPRQAPRDSVPLTQPPARVDSLGAKRHPAMMDSLFRMGIIRAGDAQPGIMPPPPGTPGHPRALPDTERVTPRDTVHVITPPDTTKHP